MLSAEERELGVMVDLGGGTTDLAIFLDGSIRHTGRPTDRRTESTKDLAIGLLTSQTDAENQSSNMASPAPSWCTGIKWWKCPRSAIVRRGNHASSDIAEILSRGSKKCSIWSSAKSCTGRVRRDAGARAL